MEEDEFGDLLLKHANSEQEQQEQQEQQGPQEQGATCRLVGRFAPVQGHFDVDCAAVPFRSAQRLRQLSVALRIPTRSILACTTEGSMMSLAVQGMAGHFIRVQFC